MKDKQTKNIEIIKCLMVDTHTHILEMLNDW